MVVPVSLNGLCCSSEVLEFLSLLAFRRDVVKVTFRKYSKEGRSSSGHLEIRNVPSDFCYDDTKYYQVPFEKQGRCMVCEKNSQHRWVKYKVNLHVKCFEYFMDVR